MATYTGWLAEVQAKEGVVIGTLRCEALLALRVAYELYRTRGRKLTVTSTNDGKHKPGSKHYRDAAFDTRVWGLLDKEKDEIVAEAKSELGRDYDVINEGDHLHFEYDPKC